MGKLRDFFKSFPNYLLLFAFIIIIISIIWGFYPPFNYGGESDSDLFAKYGTFIGGLFGTILSFIAIYFIYLNLKSQKDNSESQDNLNTFFKMIEDLRYFEMNLRSFRSGWLEKYKVKMGRKEHVVKEKISSKGLENFRHLSLKIIGLYEGYEAILEFLDINKVDIKDKPGQVKYIYRLYGGYLKQYINKLIFILEIAEKYDKNNDQKFYQNYTKTCINIYAKFLIAFLYINDSEFKYKEIIDKYSIVDKGEFDSMITKNDEFLNELYNKTCKL